MLSTSPSEPLCLVIWAIAGLGFLLARRAELAGLSCGNEPLSTGG
jgi:hypothetical protein